MPFTAPSGGIHPYILPRELALNAIDARSRERVCRCVPEWYIWWPVLPPIPSTTGSHGLDYQYVDVAYDEEGDKVGVVRGHWFETLVKRH